MSDNNRLCIVLKCGNSSFKTPDKLFIPVPNQARKRKKWLTLAHVDPKNIETSSNVFMCEDHFDIQKDIPNYMKFKMGFTQKIVLIDRALPSKFDCHEDSKRPSEPGPSEIIGSKIQKIELTKNQERKRKASQCDPQNGNNLQGDRKPYRWCAVPGCNNTSVTASNKIFACVPQKTEIRKKWFELAGRNPDIICENTTMFFCEDHFDLPNDMVNYMRYRVMGSVKKVLMRPGCLPSKFECLKLLDSIPITSQINRNKKTANTQDSLGEKFTMDNESGEGTQFMMPNMGPRCPMIQIPLAAYQFAPPVQSDTDSDTDIGTDLFSQESAVPSDTVINEMPIEVHIKPEIAEDVLDNVSMYGDEQSAPSLQKDSEAAGKVTLFGGFQCSVCDGAITGFRYTCVQCNDFDLCHMCETNRAHDHHYLLRVPSLNPYPEVQLVMATIRRHLMMDLDPISEPGPDPAKSVKTEIKSESEEEIWKTADNDGFNEVDTSDMFEQEDTNIPSVRPVAVIRVSKKHDSFPTLERRDEMNIKTEPTKMDRSGFMSPGSTDIGKDSTMAESENSDESSNETTVHVDVHHRHCSRLSASIATTSHVCVNETQASSELSSIHRGYPRTAAERMQAYRARKKKETPIVNRRKLKKSDAQRANEYRARKKAKMQSAELNSTPPDKEVELVKIQQMTDHRDVSLLGTEQLSRDVKSDSDQRENVKGALRKERDRRYRDKHREQINERRRDNRLKRQSVESSSGVQHEGATNVNQRQSPSSSGGPLSTTRNEPQSHIILNVTYRK